MGKTHKIYNWQEWKDICDQYNIDPYEYADFSIGAQRQISGGDTIDFEYKGDVPKNEED